MTLGTDADAWDELPVAPLALGTVLAAAAALLGAGLASASAPGVTPPWLPATLATLLAVLGAIPARRRTAGPRADGALAGGLLGALVGSGFALGFHAVEGARLLVAAVQGGAEDLPELSAEVLIQLPALMTLASCLAAAAAGALVGGVVRGASRPHRLDVHATDGLRTVLLLGTTGALLFGALVDATLGALPWTGAEVLLQTAVHPWLAVSVGWSVRALYRFRGAAPSQRRRRIAVAAPMALAAVSAVAGAILVTLDGSGWVPGVWVSLAVWVSLGLLLARRCRTLQPLPRMPFDIDRPRAHATARALVAAVLAPGAAPLAVLLAAGLAQVSASRGAASLPASFEVAVLAAVLALAWLVAVVVARALQDVAPWIDRLQTDRPPER